MITRLFMCIIICTAFGFGATAQKYYGQWTVSAFGQYGNDGTGGGVNAEKYFGRSLSGIRFGINMKHQKITAQDWKLPVNTFLADASYFYSLERYMSESIFVNAGAGLFFGGEQVVKTSLPEGVLQEEGMKFIAGLSIHPQVEFIFKRKCNFSGFVEPSISYCFTTRFDKFSYGCRAGIKYYLPL